MKKYIFLFQLITPFFSNAQTLTEAISAKDTLLIAKLIKEGSDPNVLDSYGTSPLMNACRWANAEIVRTLLSNGATVDSPRSAKGRTPLIVACAYYSGITVCRLLIEHGADVNALTSANETALMLAASNAKVAVVDYLLEKGANPNLKDAKGKTALDYAIAADITEYIKSMKDTPIDKEAVIATLKKVTKQD